MKIYRINQSNDISFVLSPVAQNAGHEIVYVDSAKFDKYFQKETDFYIGEGGSGNSIGDRYNRFKDFLGEGIPIEVSQVYISDSFEVGFGNGRHRYAVLRDMGYDKIPVSMSEESIERAKEMGII
jgi:hypothetical protein